MIQRVLSTTHNLLTGSLKSYNGHLYIICYFVYKAQLAFGLSGHAFIWIMFCASLAGLDISLTFLLSAAGVPVLTASVAGFMMAYFGPGAQLMTFEFQFTMDAAIALPLLAAYFVFRWRDRYLAAVLPISTILLFSVIFDSATASAGLLFVAILLWLRWRDRWAIIAMAPSLIVSIVFLMANRGALLTAAASPGQEALFATRLLLRSLGGLVGGGEVAGAVALVISAAGIAWALYKDLFSQETRHVLTAGLTSGLVMDAVTAWSRAGLVGDDFFDFNRYISLVAVYLLAAMVPAAVDIVRSLRVPPMAAVEPTLAALLVVVFLLNLRPLTHYRNTIQSWMAQTHALVPHVDWVISKGCPTGRRLDATAEPLGTLDPQVTVGLLDELLRLGALKVPVRPPAASPTVTPTAWRAAVTMVCSLSTTSPSAT